MITGITIERLRGIKHGEVPGLTGLSILVGPNGCGKSTVLDALLIGGSPSPGDAVGRAVLRRVETRFGLRWLLWRDDDHGDAQIAVSGIPAFDSTSITRDGDAAVVRSWKAGEAGIQLNDRTDFRPDNSYAATPGKRPAPFLRLIDAAAGAAHAPLSTVFSDAKRLGRSALAQDMLTALIPGFSKLEVLTDPANYGELQMEVEGRTIPVTMAGEGIVVLVRAVLELGLCTAGGTALLEEPEVHQHPRTLRLMAQGICEAVKRGVQVVLTTHSLELIENLLYFAGQAEILDRTAVHMVRLRENVLTTTRVDGESARFQIQEIGEDLR